MILDLELEELFKLVIEEMVVEDQKQGFINNFIILIFITISIELIRIEEEKRNMSDEDRIKESINHINLMKVETVIQRRFIGNRISFLK